MAIGDGADGVAAFMLTTQILLVLQKKGLFSQLETKEIVEQCLLNFETQQANSEPSLAQLFQRSREPLEQLRTALSPPT